VVVAVAEHTQVAVVVLEDLELAQAQ